MRDQRLDLVLESVLGALVTVGTGLVGGSLIMRPGNLVAGLVPACALLIAAAVGVILRRRCGVWPWRTVGLIVASAALSAGGAISRGPVLYSILSILSLTCAVGVLLLLTSAKLGGMNRQAVAEVLALPILGALQMAFCGGWLQSRGSLSREMVPQDQSILSLAILAIVAELLVFRRWKDAITRENGVLQLPASLSRWGYVGLSNLKAWGISLGASGLLLMTITQEGAVFGWLAAGAMVIGQVMGWVLVLAAERGTDALRGGSDVSMAERPEHKVGV